MTASAHPHPRAVPWLASQALLFGAMAAFLGVAANTLFLQAYGAGWLPATYIAIGAAGLVVSGAVARTAQRFDLVEIALVVLGAAAVGLALAWLVARAGNTPWVSIPLLVLFPILIQLGFVFLGAQAGRLLDIAGLKASFPRIMAGFPVGAVLGGLAAGQIVVATGGVEALLLAATLCQAGFAGLVWATARRHPTGRRSRERLGRHDVDGAHADPSIRRLLASRFVALILAYQVLSALASQLADYLVYDRANALLSDPTDLARFLAGFTAAMNAASIAFLVLLAGPLLRRFGLRLGIAANPFVLAGFGIVMLGVLGGAGGASTGMLLTVAAARIADVALTDGTTRTSINVTFQAIPERSRLVVQAAVEGIGVPLAIALSGVLILALNVLPDALGATVATLLVTCIAWSAGAVLLVRAYGPALVHALRRRPHLVPAGWDASADDEAAFRRLTQSPDARDARAAIEILRSTSSPGLAADLAALADDPRPDVRMAALAELSSTDAAARARLGALVAAAATAADADERLLAARSIQALDAAGRARGAALLDDRDVRVRLAALDSVTPDDAFALEPALRALGDPRTAGAAGEAIDRLGDAAVPALEAHLASPSEPTTLRLVRGLRTLTPAREAVLVRHLGHPDRELGLAVIERLTRSEPAAEGTAAALDGVLQADAAHAARVLAALAGLAPMAATEDPGSEEHDLAPVRRSLEEELDLVGARVAAACVARHGQHDVGPAILAVRTGGPAAAVAAEALAMLLPPSVANPALAILDARLAPAQRLGRLPRPARIPADVSGWLTELVDDPDDKWRSPWLQACAVQAMTRRR